MKIGKDVTFAEKPIKIILKKRKRILSINRRQFINSFTSLIEESTPSNVQHYDKLREDVAIKLGIKSVDVDRIFYGMYYYSPTFRNNLWIFVDASADASKILQKSGLEDFDRRIRMERNLYFGWDAMSYHNDFTLEMKEKILKEWESRNLGN